MSAPHEKLGIALGVIGTCLFGATLPATRLAVDFFDPLFVSVFRAVVAGTLGIIVLFAMRRSWPSRRMLGELFSAAPAWSGLEHRSKAVAVADDCIPPGITA
jgi:drug/metabolite transporter (DMT)-like permease